MTSIDHKQIEDLIWRGETDCLERVAPCKCCCHEHTFFDCKAKSWGGCKGQYAVEEDADEWAAFYERTRGMSRDVFFEKEASCSSTE